MLGYVAALFVMMLAPSWQQSVEEMKVYWSEPWQHRIMRCTLNGTELEVYRSDLENPYGVAIDLPNGMIYWAVRKKIQRAHLSDLVTAEDWVLESEGLLFPGGLALDETNRMLYWVDMTTNKVQRKSLDGGSIEDVSTDESVPQGVAVDEHGDQIYWLSLGEGKVFARDMALSSAKREVASGLSSPYGIVVDSTNNKLYWSNRNSNSIQRWDLQAWGSAPEDFLTGLNGPMGLTIDVASQTLYWLSRDTEMVNRIDLDGTGGVEDVVTAGNGYYLSVGFYAELEQTTSTTSSTFTSKTDTTKTTSITSSTASSSTSTGSTSTASTVTMTITTDPDATTSLSSTFGTTTKTDTTTTGITFSTTSSISSSATTILITTFTSTTTTATETSSSTSGISLTSSSTSTSSLSRMDATKSTITGVTSTFTGNIHTTSTASATITASISSTITRATSTKSTSMPFSKTSSFTTSTGILGSSTNDPTTSEYVNPFETTTGLLKNMTGILATSATTTTSLRFTSTSTSNNESIFVVALLTPEDEDIITVIITGSLVGIGAALLSGLFLLKKYGLLRPSRLCSKWKTKVKSMPEETAMKEEADMQDARRTSGANGWPIQPDVSIPTVQGGEELLAKLQEFFKASGSDSRDVSKLVELLEQWKQSTAHGELQVTIAEIVKEVLSDPVAVSGEEPFISLEKFDPVVKNAWQKRVRSADQLPQEKREELFEAGEELIRILRRTVNTKFAPDAEVIKDTAEVRQEWRNRWPFEGVAGTAIQSIEMAVTSAAIQKMHLGSSSLPEVSDVMKSEVKDPHALETLPEETPKLAKNKSLRARLEELSNHSKQKTMEMNLHTAGDQLLVELSNILETRVEGFPAEAVSETVTLWQRLQSEQLPDAAANVAQMAQLARSVISHAPGKDIAGLRAMIEEAWKQGKLPETLSQSMGESSMDVGALKSSEAMGAVGALKASEVLKAGEDLLAQLEQISLESRSVRSLDAVDVVCEDWKIQQLKVQGVIMDSDTGRFVEGLADFVKASLQGSQGSRISEVRQALEVLKSTEMLFKELQSGDLQDLQTDLQRVTETWMQKQLETLDGHHGHDEVVEQWLRLRVDATNAVLKQEVGSVEGVLGHINIEKLGTQIQEIWLEPLSDPAELVTFQAKANVAEASQVSLMVNVLQSGEAFSKAREKLFSQVTKQSPTSIEERVDAWQQDLAEHQFTHLTSGLAKLVVDACSSGQLKHVQVTWHKQMEKVLQNSGKLMKDLDNLLKSSFARLGDDLRSDIQAECDLWTAKQLNSQKLAPDSSLAELYRGFVEVVDSVMRTAAEVTVARADSSFDGLRSQIQDAWHECMEGGHSEKSHEAKNQDVEVQLEKIKPSKVVKDGKKLLDDLEDIFRCSWARPGEDLMPEIMKQCNDWTSTQVEGHSHKAMYEGFAEVVQSVVQVHAVDGKVVGDADFFNLKTDIKETWKQRTATTQAAAQSEVQQFELNKERRAPKTERHGKSQAVQDAKQFLKEMMEVLVQHGSVDFSRLMEQGHAWRQERLEVSNLTQESEMGVWLQSLLDSMQTVVREATAGEALSSAEFSRLQPKILEIWKHQLHGAQHVHFDSQTPQGRGRSLPRDRSQSKVEVAKENLKLHLQALIQKGFEPRVLEQKVEELLQSWQQQEVTDDIDSITGSLLKSLAQAARQMASAGPPAGQVAPLFEEAWKAQQRLTWCPSNQAEVAAKSPQADRKKRNRSRPREGRPPKPRESMDILDRFQDGGMEAPPEVDSLGTLERGFRSRDASRTSRTSNSPHPSHYGDFEVPSRGSSVHADCRGTSPSPAPSSADLLRLKYSRPARMAGASMVKVQR